MAEAYILTKPADIAMKYGNDKKKIQQAAQMGVVDPTAAVLAGMFIDRVLAEAQAAQTNNLTVAQETFPQMAPQMAGLGATPQAAMAPQMAPTEAGVAALPVPDDMVPDEFAGGGLVAFDQGGPVARYQTAGLVDYSQFGEYGEELKRQEALRKLYMGENEALKAEREGMKAAADRREAMRYIEMGLGIAGGTSANPLENLKTGVTPVIGRMMEDEAAQRKRKAELAGAERAEKGKVLEAAIGATQAREKLTPEAIRTAREIQAEAKAAGKPVPTLAQALKSIERTPQTTTLEAAYVRAKADAAEAVGKLVNSSVFNAEVKSIEKKQGKAAAEEYKRRRIAETVALYPGVDPASVMASIGGGRAPSSAPTKPTLSEFLEKARKVNPGVSDGELTKYYKENYGK